MNMLSIKAIGSLLCLFLAMAALIFIPAGTLDYWQACVFLAAYFIPSFLITLYLIRRNPALLARRMKGGPTAEKEPAQKIIMLLISGLFVALVAVSALDHRFMWSDLAPPISFVGDILVLVGWVGIVLVFNVNVFAASTVELADDHKVISNGPYARIRHPMYAAAFVLLLGIPLALGSWAGLFVLVAMFPLFIWRLLDEEKFLMNNLAGYTEYQNKTRYRLIPYLW